MTDFLVRIDYSQTQQSTILVRNCETSEEAVEEVWKGTNCPRVYQMGKVDSIITKE